MKTAKVAVLHAFYTPSGWVMPCPEHTMDADEARALEVDGYVDVLEVDGKPEVWGSCCSGQHDH